jgi:AmiR/NasT family two-component response regulator
MVSAQAHCTLDAALALMRNTARATDETLENIAARIVEGKLRFE